VHPKLQLLPTVELEDNVVYVCKSAIAQGIVCWQKDYHILAV
jgi:hypothetical protein